MSSRDGLKPTGHPGVFYKEHETRKHGIRYDRQWIIRQTLGGKTRISALGWTSEGILLGDALNKTAEYKTNFRWNLTNLNQPSKPLCTADELALSEDKNEDFPIFADFAERFILQHVKKKLAAPTAKEYERQIRKHLIPAWGKRKVVEIKRKHIVNMVEKISDTAPVQGNRTLATIKKLFSYALDVGVVDVNPASRIKPPGKEHPRTRVLDLEELTTLFKTLETLPDRDTRDILQLITLTAQRPGEVAEMCFSQLKEDDQGLWFEIKPDKTKNKEPQRIFLNDMAAAIIKARINDMGLSNHIFPADSKSGFMRKDVLVSKVKRIQPTMQKQEVNHFTAHDLRRSAATGLARLGHGAIIDDILNHKQKGITRRVYDLYSRAPEIQRALTAWGEAVQRAITGNQAEVVPINQQH